MTTTHGPSILERLWEELDDQFGKLMEMQNWRESDRVKIAQRGHCLGIAKCIAIMTDPYDPNVDAVRQKAMERYEANHNRV